MCDTTLLNICTGFGGACLLSRWSFAVVADILCEFLEVAIHLILYVREVYPSGIFQKRKKYNVPVQVDFYVLLPLICSCLEVLAY